MWILKQRHIVNELYRFIWKEKHVQMNEYKYKTNGVPLKDFTDWLFGKEMWLPSKTKFGNFTLSVKKFLDKKYIDDFYYRNEEIIKDCIKDGYIDINGTVLTDNSLLTINPKGKRFISFGHNISEILKHPFILKLIEFGFPFYFIYKIIKLFIH